MTTDPTTTPMTATPPTTAPNQAFVSATTLAAPLRTAVSDHRFVRAHSSPALRPTVKIPVATQLIISNRSACRLETHLTPIPATKLRVLIDTNVATSNTLRRHLPPPFIFATAKMTLRSGCATTKGSFRISLKLSGALGRSPTLRSRYNGSLMATAYLSLGSRIGDRAGNIARAVALLRARGGGDEGVIAVFPQSRLEPLSSLNKLHCTPRGAADFARGFLSGASKTPPPTVAGVAGWIAAKIVMNLIP
jgi:hypothetical protein